MSRCLPSEDALQGGYLLVLCMILTAFWGPRRRREVSWVLSLMAGSASQNRDEKLAGSPQGLAGWREECLVGCEASWTAWTDDRHSQPHGVLTQGLFSYSQMLSLCLWSYRSFHVDNMSHLIRYLRTDSLVLLLFFCHPLNGWLLCWKLELLCEIIKTSLQHGICRTRSIYHSFSHLWRTTASLSSHFPLIQPRNGPANLYQDCLCMCLHSLHSCRVSFSCELNQFQQLEAITNFDRSERCNVTAAL